MGGLVPPKFLTTMGFIDTLNKLNPVANVVSSVVGAISGNRQIDKSIASQERENERNRQFNKEQAEQQNIWNIQQWERENLYNSPAEQIKRLRQAGINPDLIYGNGTLQNVASSSPGLVASQHNGMADYSQLTQKKTLGSVMQDNLIMQQMRAQIDNIKADTGKKKSETTGQDIANSWQDILNSSHVNLSNVQVHLGEKDIILRDAEAQRAYKDIDMINQRIKESQSLIKTNESKIANIDEQTLDLQLTRDLRKGKLSSEIRQLSALANESEKTLIPKLKQFALDALKSQGQITQLDLGNIRLNMENGILQVDYDKISGNNPVAKVNRILDKVTSVQKNILDVLFNPVERTAGLGGKILGAIKQ